MVDFTFKRKAVRIRECAFCGINEIGNSKADVVYLHSTDSGEKDVSKSIILQKQYTLLTDLKYSEEELLENIKKNCKYEIRRSEREEAQVHFFEKKQLCENSEIIKRFETAYNQMFGEKGLSGYRFNRKLVEKAIESNSILISSCTNINGDNEVFHAYLHDNDSCVLMYSASPLWGKNNKDKANEIGRMNKYLHWKDIQYFKNNGFSRYEWGGITDPDKPNGIDKFKMEFGGRVIQCNNYIIPISLFGRVYTYLVRRRSSEK